MENVGVIALGSQHSVPALLERTIFHSLPVIYCFGLPFPLVIGKSLNNPFSRGTIFQKEETKLEMMELPVALSNTLLYLILGNHPLLFFG